MIVGVAILVGIGALAAWGALRSPTAIDGTTAQACPALYARARTAADSGVIDGYRPRTTRAGSAELRCGVLRSLGRSR